MRFDLHIHSNYSSDSSLSVDEILKQAVNKGLDGIAICDHNTIAGSFQAQKRARELDLSLLVLSGIEVSTTNGHLLVLGVRENIPPDLSPQETIRIAHQKGGVVIAAHPFKIRSIGNVDGLDVDAIETLNSRCIFGENIKAKDMAQVLGKPQVGGSDSHMLSTIGIGYTEIDSDPDEEAVLSAIREGRTGHGGQVAPLYVICIQVVRGVFRRVNRFGKELYSKIFHNDEPM
ncbi:MAG: CehA/McbA family metallohydrolase [Candidatus Methanoperedens sp.]|nr:CehA/McbA family metallohydrolase [Candidatus Methanoperedens sp.]